MAFELKDWFMQYTPRGSPIGLFNVARSDIVNAGLRYYAYQNEAGSYIIQRYTTSGTVKIYEYYAKRENGAGFAVAWSSRGTLAFVEYYQLFRQE